MAAVEVAPSVVPVILAAAVWGPARTRMQVIVHCDNEAVVCAINKGRAMQLLRCLFFLTACNDVVLVASHIPGRTNLLADAISRNQSPLSFQMSQHPTPIPPVLAATVLDKQAGGPQLVGGRCRALLHQGFSLILYEGVWLSSEALFMILLSVGFQSTSSSG